MKIVAGLCGVDAYDASCDAGADELFCGYVPESWAARYGLALPLNRREVRYYNVQLGGHSELLILADKIARRGVPVTITLNSLHYIPEQYPIIGELVSQCITDGFRSFIVADPALLLWLHRQGLDREARLHVSGELGEVNRGVVRLCRELGAQRIILHRKVTLNDMAALITREPGLEYEAFALNELCHFHGGLCHSLHCDELPHLCRIPCHLGGVVKPMPELPEAPEHPVTDGLGATGCGLCALWRLRQIGVTHLKLVGRGNLPDALLRDIAALRQAIDLAETTLDEVTYIDQLRSALFPNGCGGHCYYPGETRSLII